MSNEQNQFTKEDLTKWIAEKIAEDVKRPVAEIDKNKPMTEYGLDSVYAFILAGDIEDYLDIELDPTIMWDYPTISALAEKLSYELLQSPEVVITD